MEEYWFLAPMLRLAISSASLDIYFLKLSTTTPPLRSTGQASRSIDKENCFV